MLVILLAACSLGVRALRADVQGASQGGCNTCRDLVHFHKHAAISWSIFPPMPLPGLDVAVTCYPNRDKKWGFNAGAEVERLLDDEDCDLGEEAEGLSQQERRGCKGAFTRLNKRSSFLGVPVAFLQQLGTCGRCTICETFAKVKGLWTKLKSAAKRVVNGMRRAKEHLFGFAYASKEVREGMEQRFQSYFPSTNSFLQESAIEATEDAHEKQVHDALVKQLHGKSAESVEKHLSMLQQRLEEADGDAEMVRAAGQKLQQQAMEERLKLEEQLPTLLTNKDCQELLDQSLVSQVLQVTLFVESPNLLNAVIHLVMGNLFGALHALIPKIYLQATPRLGDDVKSHSAEKCLQALQEERQPLLDSCTHEHPLLACTARTYQRLMEGALSQQWWPLKHDEHGTTVGSIDLGYKYDELRKSLRCSAEHSCLEKSVVDLQKKEVSGKTIRAEAWSDELSRLEEMQCAVAGSKVDAGDQDGQKGTLPAFTDKIWAAGLKAFGRELAEGVDHTLCPNMMPFALAYCANELNCMDVDTAGQGFLKPSQFNVVKATSEKKVEAVKSKASGDLERIEGSWEEMMSSQAEFWGTTREKDVSQWNLLWHLANYSNQVGILPTWPTIRDAVLGSDHGPVDWRRASALWEKIFEIAFAKLKIREMERPQEKASNEQSLVAVMGNLRAIYDTKFCSPGALGSLSESEEAMERLGVPEDDRMLNAALGDSESSVIQLWKGWTVFNIQLDTVDRVRLDNFKALLKNSSCSCMCYDQCGAPKASAFVHCNAGRKQDSSHHKTEQEERVLDSVYVPKVVVDRIYMIGEVYEPAVVKIIQTDVPGDCGYRFQMEGHVSERVNRGKKVTLSGYISECDAPDFFDLTNSGVRVTTWTGTGEHGKDFFVPFLFRPNGKVPELDSDILQDMHASVGFW